MKKILVTGGTGFIGHNIVESYLAEQYEIVAPRRAELNLADDNSIQQYFTKHSFDVVIHSAAKPGHRNAEDTSSLLLTNSRMMANLLKYQDSWGKLLNMGSGAVYDMRHYQPKMKESYFGTHIPADEHGYNKYMLGKLLPSLTNVYDFRIFGIYGKYEDYAIRFISNAICKALFDLPITLRQNRKFDYLYINDLMPVLEYFIEHSPEEKSFNITPDESIGLLDIAHMVRATDGNKVAVKVAQEGLGMEYSGDNSLLRTTIKTINFTPIEKGIEQLYKWYADNRDTLNRALLIADK